MTLYSHAHSDKPDFMPEDVEKAQTVEYFDSCTEEIYDLAGSVARSAASYIESFHLEMDGEGVWLKVPVNTPPDASVFVDYETKRKAIETEVSGQGYFDQFQTCFREDGGMFIVWQFVPGES